jgi:hypothetical protein
MINHSALAVENTNIRLKIFGRRRHNLIGTVAIKVTAGKIETAVKSFIIG